MIDLRTAFHRTLMLLVAVVMPVCLLAQEKKKMKGDKEEDDEPVPVYNYVIDDPMDVFGRNPEQTKEVRYMALPDFCRIKQVAGDTTIGIVYHDIGHNPLQLDTLTDGVKIAFVSVTKSYVDGDNTYRDAQGKQQPLVVTKIAKRYDKTGADKWLYVDYAGNKTTNLKGMPGNSAGQDTLVVTDPVQNKEITIVRKFYKTAPVR